MIEPTYNHVLLKESERQHTTDSGIVVAQPEKQAGDFYEVVDFGPEANRDWIAKGDIVVINDFMADEVHIGDEKYGLAEVEDILGVWRDS